MWFGDKFGIFSRYFSVVVQGFVFGSVFYNMPLTATGGFTRGGALFSSLLFNAFVCFSFSRWFLWVLIDFISCPKENFLVRFMVVGLFKSNGLTQCTIPLHIIYHRYNIVFLFGCFSAHSVKQVIIDIPVMFVQCLGFALITYFLYGLDPDAGKFFVHVFILTLMALCCTNMFRYV